MEKVSVIVSVYNGERTIAKCLDSLLALDYPDFEVIVIDDYSNSETFIELAPYRLNLKYTDRVLVWRNGENIGQALSRNKAVGMAKGDYVAFIDADVVVDKNWLKELMSIPYWNTGGKQLCPFDASPTQKKIFAFLQSLRNLTEYQSDKPREVTHLPSCNVVYHKELFLQFGGFRNLRYGEDVDLNHRICREGYRLLYNPRAICYHYPPETIKAFLKKTYKYGEAQGKLVKQYGLFRKLHLIPFFTLAILTILIILWGRR
jgi:glycosyltransferase involved in cell wall biosynthesis